MLFALYLTVLGQGAYPPRATLADYRGQTTWGNSPAAPSRSSPPTASARNLLPRTTASSPTS